MAVQQQEISDHIRIRRAVAADAEALARFAQKAFAETFAYRDYPAEDLAQFFADYMSATRFAEQIADPNYRVELAVHAGNAPAGYTNTSGAQADVEPIEQHILGFVKTGPMDLPVPPISQQETADLPVLELHQLYLDSSMHGIGLADRMMDLVWAQARAMSAAAIYLSVYSENLRAQRFYARHGFKEIGKNPFAVGRVIDDDRIWKAVVR
jgi:ribosomal protein S18 acetylase RimI-like enzyme